MYHASLASYNCFDKYFAGNLRRIIHNAKSQISKRYKG